MGQVLKVQWLSFFDLPSSGSDIVEIMKEVTFKPFENMTCAEVAIVDDTDQELPETFTVAFGASNVPGVQPGAVTVSVITILDDDLPGKLMK